MPSYVFTVAEYNASIGTLTAADDVTIADAGLAIDGLTPADLAAFAANRVVAIDATNDSIFLSTSQLEALGTVRLTAADLVVLADRGAELGTGTLTQISTLDDRNVDRVDVTDNALPYSLAQLNALPVPLTAGDVVFLTDSGATLGSLGASDITSLAARGVVGLNATDDTMSLSLAQYQALGSVALAHDDVVRLTDAGAALAALTPAQLAALNGKGIDALNATDNVLALSLAQYQALGSVGLTADDAVRLTDAGATLSSLSAGQIAEFAARGVDVLDATDNAVSLSLAQYQPLGALQFSTEDRLTLSGTSVSERVDGRVNNEYIKGFGGDDRLNGGDGRDWISGGTGKDVLTGGRDTDVFVFDTKPNKKTNLDTIKDFNARDDSLYLDNAIFKKLGKGSEANPGKLNKAFFQIGERADDRNDYLIYNKKTGILYYDSDGSGSATQVEIAKLSKNLKLTEKDFFII